MTPPSAEAAPAGAPVAPLLVSVRAARATFGIGHTKIYELLARGSLRARKLGGRTMVETASLAAYVAALPVATFGARDAEAAAEPARAAPRRTRAAR